MAPRRAHGADAHELTRLIHASSAYAGRYAAILDGYAVTPAQIERDLVSASTNAWGHA